jgi:hypothetical protein
VGLGQNIIVETFSLPDNESTFPAFHVNIFTRKRFSFSKQSNVLQGAHIVRGGGGWGRRHVKESGKWKRTRLPCINIRVTHRTDYLFRLQAKDATATVTKPSLHATKKNKKSKHFYKQSCVVKMLLSTAH